METFLLILHYFTTYAMPPILGGVIGLFTNWLALQMLFRPYKAIYIGKFRLPFTPGIIPKRKESLARAAGKAVADEVITDKELAEVFQAPKMKEKFVETVLGYLYEGEKIGSFLNKSNLPQTFSTVLSDKIVHAVMLSDVEALITEYGAGAIRNHTNNPLVMMLLNERFLSSVGQEISAALKNYLFQHGREIIAPKIEEEISALSEKNGGQLLEEFHVSREKTRDILISFYDKFTTVGLKKLLASADIASVIEDKINSMETKQIADLIFRVMNKEMKAVIYLGGFLGMLIGVVNIFI